MFDALFILLLLMLVGFAGVVCYVVILVVRTWQSTRMLRPRRPITKTTSRFSSPPTEPATTSSGNLIMSESRCGEGVLYFPTPETENPRHGERVVRMKRWRIRCRDCEFVVTVPGHYSSPPPINRACPCCHSYTLEHEGREI